MKLKNIQGIIPAVFTPMFQNGSINLEAIDHYVEYLSNNGIKDIFILGTAGEGMHLTIAERKQVAEKWMEASKNKIPNVILHVGSGNLEDTIELSKHGKSIGVNAIAVMAPCFFRPSSVSTLADHIENIANTVPDTPVLYYHFPTLNQVSFNMKSLLDEIKQRKIKNFAGIKYTSTDLCDFGCCCASYKDEYTLCYGYDEQAMAGLMLGADSCVGSTFNYCPGLYKRIFDACKEGDVERARENQYLSVQLIGALFKMGFNMGINKALMGKISGVDVGPVRSPLEVPSPEKMDEILKDITELGFFKWH